MANVADNYLIVHSVCVKCLHETNVQTSWSSESGNNVGHMTNMPAMKIYSKTPLKSSSQEQVGHF